MRIERSPESTDYQTIAVMVAILAGLIGLLGFALNDPTVDLASLHPIAAATARTTTPDRPQGVKPVAAPAATTVTPEENWAPDESSHGLRPDAAH